MQEFECLVSAGGSRLSKVWEENDGREGAAMDEDPGMDLTAQPEPFEW